MITSAHEKARRVRPGGSMVSDMTERVIKIIDAWKIAPRETQVAMHPLNTTMVFLGDRITQDETAAANDAIRPFISGGVLNPTTEQRIAAELNAAAPFRRTGARRSRLFSRSRLVWGCAKFS
jgi:hypothetical protein